MSDEYLIKKISAVNLRFRAAGRAALLHCLGCLVVALIAAALVFGIWFPHPYEAIEGGGKLFALVISIDVVCGPLLTFILFDPKKSNKELVRDLSFVVLVQLAALVYGLCSVYIARPVFLAFEVDRFQVISAAEISEQDLSNARQPFQKLSVLGPAVIAVEVPKPGDPTYLQSIELTLNGLEPSLRPSLWRSYDEQRESVKRKLRSIAELKLRHQEKHILINSEIAKTGMPEDELGYLPVVGRGGSGWIALITRNEANLLGFVEVDGF
ncbi:TfpX/TfpZ family type IV pilin accessory protein [Variovorax paradoxus]|uniref:TfpX/TfpZ family type IV pilin accessory protein n=1 Tax=Variovorax paradoxus TaxID=34073 RepID=UPI0027D8C6C5|nr:TfpX/TfpZ family type IV pilin accessory protein [Variovorax paradoxus]